MSGDSNPRAFVIAVVFGSLLSVAGDAIGQTSSGSTTDLFCAPLTVQRTMSSASTIDPMFNARALISYRVTR